MHDNAASLVRHPRVQRRLQVGALERRPFPGNDRFTGAVWSEKLRDQTRYLAAPATPVARGSRHEGTRKTRRYPIRAGATSTGDGFQAPDRVDADRQLELAVSRVLRNADRRVKLAVIADSGTTLTPGQAWMLGQVYWRGRYQDAVSVQRVARAHKVPPEIMDPAFRQFASAGYIDLDDGTLTLTPAGQLELHRLTAAWRQWLDSRLEDWTPSDPEDRARLERAIDHIATKLLEEEQARTTNRSRSKPGSVIGNWGHRPNRRRHVSMAVVHVP